ncbi:hypothetical protein ACFWN2_27025 [Lentzea sp. NPDC058436]
MRKTALTAVAALVVLAPLTSAGTAQAEVRTFTRRLEVLPRQGRPQRT